MSAPLAYVRAAWSRRELLRQLAWRELKAGRRQSLLGLAWILVQPAAYLLVFTLVFAHVARPSVGGVPYPLFFLAGLVPWMFFSGAVSAAVGSVVGMADLVRKSAFPRVFCPLAAMAAHLTNLLAGLGFMAALMLYYGLRGAWTPEAGAGLLWGAPALLSAAALAVGCGLLLSALNVYTRDAGSIVPLLVQVWFFATPVFYPPEMVRAALERAGLWSIYRLNPMYGAVEGFRAALLGRPIPWPEAGAAAACSLAVLLAGAWIFARLERNFADVI